MGRSCTVCSHPDALVINEALVLEKKSNRRVAARYELSEQAIRRHKEHIPELLVEAVEMQGLEQAEDLLDSVRGLQARTVAILNEAEERAELRTALGAIREVRGNLELLARLRHLINERPVTVVIHPALADAITAALHPFPQAGAAVADALEDVEKRLELEAGDGEQRGK